MSETLVRLEGAQEIILEKLLSLGIFKTRSEVIRAGILGLGKEYKLFSNAQELEDDLVIRKMQKIDEEVNAGKRKLITLDESLKRLKIKRADLK